IGVAGGTNANLMGYLFGSLATISTSELVTTAIFAAVILLVGLGGRTALFAVSQDEEFARSAGLPVRVVNIAIAVVAALTVTVAMRVVGLLLVSALMIVPVAIAQQLTSSFRRTMTLAMGLGAVLCVIGLLITFTQPLAPGATIVVLAVATYAVVAIARSILRVRRPRRVDPHPNVPDDVSVAEREVGPCNACPANVPRWWTCWLEPMISAVLSSCTRCCATRARRSVWPRCTAPCSPWPSTGRWTCCAPTTARR